MILLNKFIQPTLATGKILHSYYKNIILKKTHPYPINVCGLYLSEPVSSKKVFVYPASDLSGSRQPGKPIYICFNGELNYFMYKMHKNNKYFILRFSKCVGCSNRITRLTIGNYTNFSYTHGVDRQCDYCKYNPYSGIVQLFQGKTEIETYTRYLNLD